MLIQLGHSASYNKYLEIENNLAGVNEQMKITVYDLRGMKNTRLYRIENFS